MQLLSHSVCGCTLWLLTLIFSIPAVAVASAEYRDAVDSRFVSIDSGTDIPTDTLVLEEVRVRSTRIREPLRFQPVDVQEFDSLRLARFANAPLSLLLGRHSTLEIRDNGPGGAATLSQRGLSPSQTSVLWEGFPLNALSLGLADLALMPARLFESVEVSPGTPASAFGGGSPGGVVYLRSGRAEKRNRLEWTQSVGAFGTYQSRLGGGLRRENLNISFQGIYRTAENDFGYRHPVSGTIQRRTHNAAEALHLSGSADYRSGRMRYRTALWIFDTDDQIPGSILASNPQAVQRTDGIRWAASAGRSAGVWNLELRTFLEGDRFRYDDPPLGIESRFRNRRLLGELELRRPSTGPVLWQGGLSGAVERVRTNNYSGIRDRRRAALRLNPEIRIEEWRLRLFPSIRGDLYSEFGQVLSPSLGLNREMVVGRLNWRAMVSRDFNPPSFNDLYWVPGGNPELNPETSIKMETGVVLEPAPFFIRSLALTAYRIRLDEGIYWYPSVSGIWSPVNVERVHAWGVEGRTEVQWNLGSLEFDWTAGADFRRSELGAERFAGDQGVGRQLRYVPQWSLRSGLAATFRSTRLHLDFRHTGERFLTEDHTSRLPSHRVLDLSIFVGGRLAGAEWQARLALNNLLDESYEVIRWYPMPGRHLEFTMTLGLP